MGLLRTTISPKNSPSFNFAAILGYCWQWLTRCGKCPTPLICNVCILEHSTPRQGAQVVYSISVPQGIPTAGANAFAYQEDSALVDQAVSCPKVSEVQSLGNLQSKLVVETTLKIAQAACIGLRR